MLTDQRRRLHVFALGVIAGALLIAAGMKWRAGRGAPRADVAPVIAGARAEPAHVLAGETVRLSAVVSLADRVEWGVNRLIVARTTNATWVAPGRPGLYRVQLVATNAVGTQTSDLLVEVRLPSSAEPRTVVPPQAWPAELIRGLDEELAELWVTADRRGNRYEEVDAHAALEQIASLLDGADRYEEAIDAYRELIELTQPADPRSASYHGALGAAAYLLGRDDEALVALQHAGSKITGMQSYFLAQLLERRGEREGAILAYQRAWHLEAGRFADPGFRAALLRIQRGDPDEEVEGALIAMARRQLGASGVNDGLEADPELAPLRGLLDRRGGPEAFAQRMLAGTPPQPSPSPPAPPPAPPTIPGQVTATRLGES